MSRCQSRASEGVSTLRSEGVSTLRSEGVSTLRSRDGQKRQKFANRRRKGSVCTCKQNSGNFFIEHKFFSGCMVLTRRSMDNVLLNSEFTHIKLD